MQLHLQQVIWHASKISGWSLQNSHGRISMDRCLWCNSAGLCPGYPSLCICCTVLDGGTERDCLTGPHDMTWHDSPNWQSYTKATPGLSGNLQQWPCVAEQNSKFLLLNHADILQLLILCPAMQCPNFNALSVISFLAAVMSLMYSTIAIGGSINAGKQPNATYTLGDQSRPAGIFNVFNALGIVAFACEPPLLIKWWIHAGSALSSGVPVWWVVGTTFQLRLVNRARTPATNCDNQACWFLMSHWTCVWIISQGSLRKKASQANIIWCCNHPSILLPEAQLAAEGICCPAHYVYVANKVVGRLPCCK